MDDEIKVRRKNFIRWILFIHPGSRDSSHALYPSYTRARVKTQGISSGQVRISPSLTCRTLEEETLQLEESLVGLGCFMLEIYFRFNSCVVAHNPVSKAGPTK